MAASLVLLAALVGSASAGEFWDNPEPDQRIALQNGTGTRPVLLDAGDLNADGYDDLAVAYAGILAVFHGSADGLVLWQQIGSYISTPAGGGDLNADGYDDLVFVGTHNELMAFPGSADGVNLDAPWTLGACGGRNPGSGASIPGDLTGDGYGDLVVNTELGGFLVFVGGVDGPACLGHFGPDSGGPHELLRAGDIDADGFADLHLVDDEYAYQYFGDPGGIRDDTGCVDLNGWVDGAYEYSVAAGGDMNGDGFPELAMGDPTTLRARFFPNEDGSYGYDSSVALSGSSRAFGRELAMGDLNADGHAELVVGAPGPDGAVGQIHVFLGGEQGVGSHGLVALRGENGSELGHELLVTGDLNGDGYRDLVGTTSASEPWVWFGGSLFGGGR